MKIIPFLLTLSLFTLSHWAYSQSDFRTGFVILNSGDTINGYLDYKGNLANTKKCVFKSTTESSNITYTASDLRAYRFDNGKYFVSKSLPPPNYNTILFLEYLINGIVDIYYYRDNVGEHYLLENEEGKLTKLKETQRKNTINGKTYITPIKEYVGILKMEFSKNMDVANKVDAVGLNHKSLIKIVNEYHDAVCDEYACIIYEKKLPKPKRSFGFVAGMQTINFSVNKGFIPQEKFDIEEFNGSKSVAIGLFYKQNLPSINERLNILYELTYSKLTLQKQWTEPAALVTITQNESYISHAFNNNVSIIYQFPKGQIQPMIFTGVFFNYFNSNYEWSFSSKNNSNNAVQGTDYSNANPFQNKDLGYALGIGIRNESFFNKEAYLSFKYQNGVGFRKHLLTNAFHLNLGIDF
jgi:hypothetical protein